MKLIFLNRYFFPDQSATSQMLSDLAFALVERGWSVHVIASRQRYDDAEAGLSSFEVVRGVTVHRVWTSRFGRSNLAGRTADYLSFYLCAAWALWKLARRGDIVVAKTDPPLISVVALPIVWLKRGKLVNWLQDLFPEVAESLGMGRGRLVQPAMNLLKKMRNYSLKSAQMNIVLGDLMAQKINAQGVAKNSISIISNWSDGDRIRSVAADENPLRREWGLEGQFVVGYSGNLGRAHEFDTVLEAIKIISASGKGQNIHFVFIGGGMRYNALRQAVEQAELQRVQFRPYQPRELLSQSLSVADIHLISLLPELEGLIVPSKFYGIAAAERASAFIGDLEGEIPRILRETDCGFTVLPGDGERLATRLLELAHDPERCVVMGERARDLFEQQYDQKIAIENWSCALQKVSDGKK